jgi:predicted nuclease with RNAse H fold
LIGGLDLAAVEKNPSGACILEELKCTTLFTDGEILSFFEGMELVGVDAPLSIEIPWRDGERSLIKEGYRPLPLSMESMKALHERAARLKKRLPLVETFVAPMRSKLVDYLARKMGWNKHERDAFLAALAVKAYREGAAKVYGKEHPIYIAPREFVEREVRRLLEVYEATGDP